MRLPKNLKDLMEKTQNPNFFEIGPEFVPPFWQNIDFIGLVSSFFAVIDPNLFGLVIFA